jgi:HD-GYP domain-containing protein (c-di-GMP phosphodiesterase class II)
MSLILMNVIMNFNARYIPSKKWTIIYSRKHMKLSIDKNLLKSLLIMGSVVEARDTYTGGHLWRVAQYAGLIGQRAGFSRNDLILVRIGGFLHDVGKVGVPDSILQKPESLDDREYEMIKTHPSIGYDLIHEHPLAILSQDVVKHHHEWFSGKGYPDGLAGEDISVFSRIVSIADAFDAMTSTRPYRERLPMEEAIRRLNKGVNSQFDGKLIAQFLEIPIDEKLIHVVGHSDHNIPLVLCPDCGPIIRVSKNTRDGDTVFCRICGQKMRLHKKDHTFIAEPLKEYGTPDDTKPEAETDQIDAFLREVPDTLEV